VGWPGARRDHRGGARRGATTALPDRRLADHAALRAAGAGTFRRRAACRENAERLLATGRSVVAFPRAKGGAAKTFRDRYRLQRFGRGGAVRLALAAGVPIVPVAIVGAEETHPILFKLETPARIFGLPFLPVTPTFPWLGPLGALPLPSKWVISFGEPLATPAADSAHASDDLLVARLTEELRSEVQRQVKLALGIRQGVFG
jgi:1-acyl-sn-glycerol-3-phosphate acyltransferase